MDSSPRRAVVAVARASWRRGSSWRVAGRPAAGRAPHLTRGARPASGTLISIENTDMKTRHFLARIAAFVTAAAAIGMFLMVRGPATNSEDATPQRDGVYLAAVD
jgi:hypothetical protein